MKLRHDLFYRSLLISLFCLTVVSVGCKSGSKNGISNPFAANSQTVPPPATFSHQSSYLGQTPGGYTPQAPATVFPQNTTVPGTIPSNVPLPADAVVPTTPSSTSPYGSINSGASTFQNGGVPTAQLAAANQPVASEWQPTTQQDFTSPVDSTPQTAYQYLESKVGTVTMVSADGRTQTSTAAPETIVVSSSQAITKITGEAADGTPAPVEPLPLYSAW